MKASDFQRKRNLMQVAEIPMACKKTQAPTRMGAPTLQMLLIFSNVRVQVVDFCSETAQIPSNVPVGDSIVMGRQCESATNNGQ
jgi:hypothetical protein